MIESLKRAIRLPSAPRIWTPGRTTPTKKRVSVLHARSWQVDRDGRLVWAEEDFQPNTLHDEGELYLLVLAFDTDYGQGFPASAPANLYLGLDNRPGLSEGDTLATVVAAEPSGNGYARIPISTSTGFTLSQPGAAYQADSGVRTFTASGGVIGPVRHRFLTTAASGTTGKLLCSVPLSVERTLQDGDKLNTTLVIAMGE